MIFVSDPDVLAHVKDQEINDSFLKLLLRLLHLIALLQQHQESRADVMASGSPKDLEKVSTP